MSHASQEQFLAAIIVPAVGSSLLVAIRLVITMDFASGSWLMIVSCVIVILSWWRLRAFVRLWDGFKLCFHLVWYSVINYQDRITITQLTIISQEPLAKSIVINQTDGDEQTRTYSRDDYRGEELFLGRVAHGELV